MRLKDLPIQRKLTTIVLLISGVALLLTSAAFIAHDLIAFRSGLIKETDTIAEVISANSTAAIIFGDDKAAREILSACRADETIRGAAIYGTNGVIFATYPSDAPPGFFPREPDPAGHRFEKGEFELFHPVVLDNARLGTLYIRTDLGPLFERLRLYGIIVFLVVCGALILAFLLSRWLHKSISRPILDLATIANAVSEQKDYSVRAHKHGEDELGKLTEAFNEMLRQIDERDAALRANQERLKLALSAAGMGIWESDIRTRKMMWDEVTHQLFGVAAGKFSGTSEHFISLIHPQDRLTVFEALEDTFKAGKEFSVEFQVIWPDLSEHYLASRAKAIPDETGKPARVIGVCVDITERKRSEEQIRNLNTELEERVQLRTAELTASNREMEAFTYSVSHDLRAPLRHIVAFGEILEEEFGKEMEPAAQDYLRRIMNGARSMSTLVDDLLNLARIGRQAVTRQPVKLNKIVDEVLAELSPEFAMRKVEWHIGDLGVADCDPGLIRQVFANLLSNAIKYTRPRPVAVIEVGRKSLNGEDTFYVKDNGVGFSMKFVDKLFGVFQRLHRAEDFEGTGVGLATVERIIRRHGGHVWAEAEIEKGATFSFTIPSADKADDRVRTSRPFMGMMVER